MSSKTVHNVHDEESSGRPSVVTDKLKARLEAKWMKTGRLISQNVKDTHYYNRAHEFQSN